MDIATVIGIIVGVGLICTSIMLSTSIMTFVDIPSVAVVIGGTFAAVLIGFPLGRVLKVFGVAKNAFFAKAQNPVENIKSLVKLAEIARRDGILSLEQHLTGDVDPFLSAGLRMAIDGQDPTVIEGAMDQEIEALMDRHSAGKALFDTVGKYAPAFGMIGTLIGLVIMLQNMADPSALGPAMAIAMITTFYGAVIANLLAMPIADKLEIRSTDEVKNRILILRGVMSIQAGDNPRVVQQKLLAFLDPKQRAALETASE
jgi:chemotaxis protein MotA